MMLLAMGTELKNGFDRYWVKDAKNAETFKNALEKTGEFRVYRVFPMKLDKQGNWLGEPEK